MVSNRFKTFLGLAFLSALLTVPVIGPGMALAAGTANVGADLQITGSASTGSPAPGAPLTYTFLVKNSGPDAATDVVFTDALPVGTTYGGAIVASWAGLSGPIVTANAIITCTSSTGTSGPITVRCALDTMAKGGSATIQVTVAAPVTAGTFSTTGVVTTSNIDSNSANNSVTVNAQVKTGTVGTTPPTQSILPATAPEPGVLLRESFGMADGQRPAGGKGQLRDVPLHTTLGGFWLEYPGSKSTQWITPSSGQNWKFAACTDDPYEMPSPLQQAQGNGCIISDWFDPITSYPTALMPFSPPADAYEISIDTWVAPIPNAYIAFGFTNSSAVTSNLATSGTLWLRLRDLDLNGGPLNYELRTGGLTGTLIASGNSGYSGWDRVSIRYTPSAATVTLSVDDTVIGTFPASIAPPKYVAFEGVGVLDNFVVRE